MSTLTPITVTALELPPADNLDRIYIILHDTGPGAGSITLTCYGRAWTSWWGSMGHDVKDFVLRCDVSYLVKNLKGPRDTVADQKYLARIVAAVQQALKS